MQAAAATDSLPLTEAARIGVVDVEGRPPIDLNRLRRGERLPEHNRRFKVNSDELDGPSHLRDRAVPIMKRRGIKALAEPWLSSLNTSCLSLYTRLARALP
jgi:hypothetical protein